MPGCQRRGHLWSRGAGCLPCRRRLGGLRHVGRGERLPLPGPRALAWAQESHIISGRVQLAQQGAGLLPSCTGHIWNPLSRGVGGRAAGCSGLPGSSRGCPPPRPPRTGEARRGRPGASMAVGGWGEARASPRGAGWGRGMFLAGLVFQLPEAAPGSSVSGSERPEGLFPVCGELRAGEAGPLPEAVQCPGTHDRPLPPRCGLLPHRGGRGPRRGSQGRGLGPGGAGGTERSRNQPPGDEA